MGVNVYLTKLRAFFIGALLGGLAGGLWVTYVTRSQSRPVQYLGLYLVPGYDHYRGRRVPPSGAILGVVCSAPAQPGDTRGNRPGAIRHLTTICGNFKLHCLWPGDHSLYLPSAEWASGDVEKNQAQL